MHSVRKRLFDDEIILERAMEVFWERGYMGASISDLIDKMEISKPGLYGAFGNKEQLCAQAVNYYLESKIKPLTGILYETSERFDARLKKYFMALVDLHCGSDGDQPRACLLIQCQSEIAGGDVPAELAGLINEMAHYHEALFVELLINDHEAKQRGSIARNRDIAIYLAAIIRALSSMARARYSRSDIGLFIENSLKAVFQPCHRFLSSVS